MIIEDKASQPKNWILMKSKLLALCKAYELPETSFDQYTIPIDDIFSIGIQNSLPLLKPLKEHLTEEEEAEFKKRLEELISFMKQFLAAPDTKESRLVKAFMFYLSGEKFIKESSSEKQPPENQLSKASSFKLESLKKQILEKQSTLKLPRSKLIIIAGMIIIVFSMIAIFAAVGASHGTAIPALKFLVPLGKLFLGCCKALHMTTTSACTSTIAVGSAATGVSTLLIVTESIKPGFLKEKIRLRRKKLTLIKIDSLQPDKTEEYPLSSPVKKEPTYAQVPEQLKSKVDLDEGKSSIAPIQPEESKKTLPEKLSLEKKYEAIHQRRKQLEEEIEKKLGTLKNQHYQIERYYHQWQHYRGNLERNADITPENGKALIADWNILAFDFKDDPKIQGGPLQLAKELAVQLLEYAQIANDKEYLAKDHEKQHRDSLNVIGSRYSLPPPSTDDNPGNTP